MSSSTLLCSRCHARLPAGPGPAQERLCDGCQAILFPVTTGPAEASPPLSEQVLGLLQRWKELRRTGREATPEELCRDCPELLGEVRQHLQKQQTLATRQELGLAETLDPGPEARARASLPMGDLPGFELLEVLGRGGMGVVYKAQHLKLNRLVAVKMILVGEHAGSEMIERFLAEARAVARVQHPNIVQIHEIGEQKGLPYLVLEFIAGGSLAESWGQGKQVPQDVAQLVETLARAMQIAHQQGIIHRDLKPANILLTADGIPKIGDFGLAKQLDEGVGRTVSGAVMGTPSYMAPEQARGQSRDVGPPTDVYALGAILYTGLAGAPPFHGPDIMEVLLQVASQDPRPPSQLVPGLPRDLETICLKCLQKSPAQRYASAEDLAEDLRRFRQGEPIKARPAGWSELVGKWIRRRPARAALMGMTLLAVVLGLAVFGIRHQVGHAQETAQQQKRIAELAVAVDSGMDAPAWNREHLEHLEALLDELHQLAPDQAIEARQRLHQRLAEVIRESFSFARHPVLPPEEIPPIKEMIQLLAQRAPALASPVRQEFANRQRVAQQVINLAAPYQEVRALFPERQFDREKEGLLLKVDQGNYEPVVFSRVRCTRNVEMEGVFQHPSWDLSGALGFILNGERDHGYVFLVQVVEKPETETIPPGARKPLTFAEVVRLNGSVSLQIWRNRLRLHETRVPGASVWPGTIKDSSLRLRAERAGDRLTFHCNDVKVVFEDALPLTARQEGVFGLSLPSGMRLVKLQAWSQSLPAAPSPLERGDELYARGQFLAARQEYHAQAGTSKAPRLRQEAQYKEALCRLVERDEAGAAELLESVARDTSHERWQLLALCQLWALRARQGKEAEADLIFRSLHPRHRIWELTLFLPDHVRYEILTQYRWKNTGVTQMHDHPNAIRLRERAVEIEEFFQGSPEEVHYSRFLLCLAYSRGGKTDKALQTAVALLKEAPLPDRHNGGWWFDLWEEYGFLRRQEKQAQRALTELDAKLFQSPGVCRAECLPLLLERACLQIALDRWQDGERDLEEYFRQAKPGDFPARFWGRASLARGLARERRGDREGARAAWRLGILTSKDGGLTWALDHARPMALLPQVILRALCQELPDAEVDRMTQELFQQMGGQVEAMGYKDALRLLLPELAPGVMGPVMRDMWQLPEGRRLARQVAFREVATAEQHREVIVYGFVRLGHRLLEPHRLTAGQEEVLRQAGHDGYAGFTSGKLGRKQLLAAAQLSASWRNQPSFFGWDVPARLFDPPLRGGMAFVFGLRYLHVFKNKKEAAVYFERARKIAAPQSQLHKQATAELEALKMK